MFKEKRATQLRKVWKQKGKGSYFITIPKLFAESLKLEHGSIVKFTLGKNYMNGKPIIKMEKLQ